MSKKHQKSYLYVPFILSLFLNASMALAEDLESGVEQSGNSNPVLTNISNEIEHSDKQKENERSKEDNNQVDISEDEADSSEKEPVKDASLAIVTGFRSVDSGTNSSTLTTDGKYSDTTPAKIIGQYTNVTVDDKGLALQYKKPIVNGEIVQFAVWSKDKGQDDLSWYSANALGAAYVDLSRHRSYGIYHIHTYVNRHGQMNLLEGQETFIKQKSDTNSKPPQTSDKAIGDIKISNVNQSQGTFDVVVNNVSSPTGLQQVYVPVWSAKGGQDDLKWYEASKQSDGSYKVTVDVKAYHKSTEGTYHAHVYYRDGANKLHVVGGKTVELKLTSQPPQTSDKAIGEIKISKVDQSQGTFDVVVSNVSSPTGLQQVYVPVWSAKGGQDDLKWYEASKQSDGSYKVTVNVKAYHKSTEGTYHAHVYYRDGANKLHVVGGKTVELKLTSQPPQTSDKAISDIRISNVNQSQGTFDVVVNNVSSPTGLQQVYVPVWSAKGGQDDLKWYEASKQSDGSYKVTVDVKAYHKSTEGTYHAHVYFRDGANKLHVVGGKTVELKLNSQPPQTSDKAIGDIKISNVNQLQGTFDVVVNNVSSPTGLQQVYVPVWSAKGGQDDLKWYEASKQSDGSYKVTVDVKAYHKSTEGTYHAHVYFRDGANKLVGIGGTSLNFNLTTKNTENTTGSASQGNYGIINKVIFLDAGHGGSDPGAMYFGETEKALNMKMQVLLKEKLGAAGFTVITTRENDTSVGLLERSGLVNQTNADLFISIHFNAAENKAIQGIETYWYKAYDDYPAKLNKVYHEHPERLKRSQYLAEAIQSGTVQKTGAINRGVQRNTFAVLRETTAPAVLVELGYMSNKQEWDKITKASYQDKLANGIVDGIKKYYSRFGR